MAKRKTPQPPNQGLKHSDKFRQFLDSKEKPQRKNRAAIYSGFTKHNFRLINQVPLFNMITMETVEL